jgi:hypothetical protein
MLEALDHDIDLIDWSDPVADHGLNEGLVGWWLADAASSGGDILFDITGRGHNGTLTNMDPATDWVHTDRPGGLTAAYDLDSTNDHVVIPDAADLKFTTDFSLAFWIYPRSFSSFDGIIDKITGGTGYGIFMTGTGGSVWMTYNGYGGALLASSMLVQDTWNHCVFTRTSGSANEWFKNGVTFSNNTSGSPSAGTATLLFSNQRGGGTKYMDGYLPDVRAYDRSLSASEVMSLYSEAQLGYPNLLRRHGATAPVFVAAAPPAGTANNLTLLGVG